MSDNDVSPVSFTFKQNLDMRTGITSDGDQVLQIRMVMRDTLETMDISLVQTLSLQEAIEVRNTINHMVDEMIKDQNSHGN